MNAVDYWDCERPYGVETQKTKAETAHALFNKCICRILVCFGACLFVIDGTVS